MFGMGTGVAPTLQSPAKLVTTEGNAIVVNGSNRSFVFGEGNVGDEAHGVPEFG